MAKQPKTEENCELEINFRENMSLRNIKKLQAPDLTSLQTDSNSESEATPRKTANNFELVSCDGVLRIAKVENLYLMTFR